ncbi:MAG: hypothetical protein HC822_17020 [Oscillochloris sp.]|nr:hypothetical protein [Oscillochloris sp.]
MRLPAAIEDLQSAADDAEALDDLWWQFHAGRRQVFIDLAQAYAQIGRPAEAEDALDAAIELDNSWFLPYLLRARLRREDGDIEGAREDLRAALQLAIGDEEISAIETELRELR